MSGTHTELAFEDAIEHHLVTHGGWTRGDPKDFDRKLALTPGDLVDFIRSTQPEAWDALHQQHGEGLRSCALTSTPISSPPR